MSKFISIKWRNMWSICHRPRMFKTRPRQPSVPARPRRPASAPWGPARSRPWPGRGPEWRRYCSLAICLQHSGRVRLPPGILILYGQWCIGDQLGSEVSLLGILPGQGYVMCMEPGGVSVSVALVAAVCRGPGSLHHWAAPASLLGTAARRPRCGLRDKQYNTIIIQSLLGHSLQYQYITFSVVIYSKGVHGRIWRWRGTSQKHNIPSLVVSSIQLIIII